MRTIIAITFSALLFCSGMAQSAPAQELNVKRASPYLVEQSIIDELVGKWKAGTKNVFEIKSIDTQTAVSLEAILSASMVAAWMATIFPAFGLTDGVSMNLQTLVTAALTTS